jgi:hypothetical protein
MTIWLFAEVSSSRFKVNDLVKSLFPLPWREGIKGMGKITNR